MKKNTSNDFFWPSYVDVMTNLFAITLVLFVVSFFLFKGKNQELEKANADLLVMEEEYQRVKDMNNALQSLDNNEYFKYDPIFQKHILTLPFEYIRDKYKLPGGLINPEVAGEISEVGISIIKTICELKEKYMSDQASAVPFNIKFLIVLEGQASRSGTEEHNDVLSYKRALYLKKFWLDTDNNVQYKGISFDSPELKCEMIVSGSGFSGSPREPDFIDGKVNTANQRFLVHIVPVIDWNSMDQK